MFDFSIVTQWFDALLRETLGLGDFLSILIECVLVGVAVLGGYALLAIALIFMERKVCAYFQCRLGPMRVGYWGLLQVLADVQVNVEYMYAFLASKEKGHAYMIFRVEEPSAATAALATAGIAVVEQEEIESI